MADKRTVPICMAIHGGAAVMLPELTASAKAPPGVWVLVLGECVVPEPGAEQGDDLKAPGQHDQDAGLPLGVPLDFVGVAQAVAGHIRKKDDIRAVACREALDSPGALRWCDADSASIRRTKSQHSVQMRCMSVCAVMRCLHMIRRRDTPATKPLYVVTQWYTRGASC